MKLAGILAKEFEDLDLYLEDHEDRLLLKHASEVVAWWYSSAATIEEIEKAARKWAINHESRQI